jgi:hypothetical protein
VGTLYDNSLGDAKPFGAIELCPLQAVLSVLFGVAEIRVIAV